MNNSSVYITWMYLVVMYIVPFTCLAAFNLKIYQQVRDRHKRNIYSMVFFLNPYFTILVCFNKAFTRMFRQNDWFFFLRYKINGLKKCNILH